MSYRKIVMIGAHPDSRGGVSSVVQVYRREGLFSDWPVTYLSTYADGNFLKKTFYAVSAAIRFLGMLVLGRVSLVHVHSASRNSFWRKSLFIFLARVFMRPVIFHLHGGEFVDFYMNECGANAKKFIKKTLDSVDIIIVLTESWAKKLSMITENTNIIAINNSVEYCHVTNEGSGRKTHSLLFLGKLVPSKGLYDLIDAVSMLRVTFSDIELVIGGSGNSDIFHNYAKKSGIDDKIKFAGWIEGKEKNLYLSHSSIFVLPSYNEGLPVSVLEAMAAGIPVVATAVGGIPDVINSGEEGILVSPSDPIDLKNAIETLFLDDDLRIKMGDAARRRMEAEFSPDTILPKIEKIYEDYGITPDLSYNP